MNKDLPKITGPLAAKVARLGVLTEVQRLQADSLGKGDDPFYSSGGHNYGRWVERGYSSAATIVADLQPSKDEAAHDYLARLRAHLESTQRDYRNDGDDVGGGAAGAVGDALLVVDRFAATYHDT